MIQGFSEDPGWNFEGGGFDNFMYMCLLTFSVMINCMCSTSRLIGFRGGPWYSYLWGGPWYSYLCGGVLGFSDLSKLLVWGCAW